MTDKPRIAIMCGVSGSGKSTAAKYIADTTGAKIVNRGQLRVMLEGSYAYSQKLEEVVRSIEEDAVYTLLANDYSVVIDGAHILPKDRHRWAMEYTLVYPMDFVGCVEVEGNLDRRMQDSRGLSETVWGGVIKGQIDKIVAPDPLERSLYATYTEIGIDSCRDFKIPWPY